MKAAAKPVSLFRSLTISHLILALLLFWTLLLYLQKTNLPASDLGRHITNGRLILQERNIFHTNRYSYATPSYEVPNHHWLFGVLVALAERAGGWPLVTLSVALVYWSPIALLVVALAYRFGVLPSAGAVFLLLPLLAFRTETRPEALSLFGVVTVTVSSWLVLGTTPWRVKTSAVIGSAIMTMLWVNTHIFFPLTIAIPLIFFITTFMYKSARFLAVLIIVNTLAIVIAALHYPPLMWYPTQIFANYPYPVAENQTIWFMLRYHFSWNYGYILMYCLVLMTGAAWLLVHKRSRLPPVMIPIALLAVIGAIGTLLLTRLVLIVVPFALIFSAFSLQALSSLKVLRHFMREKKWQDPRWGGSIVAGMFILLVVVFAAGGGPVKNTTGLGILPGSDSSADFFRSRRLPQPIFNNYDIGGYLIYALYPDVSVYFDNRPEAYPAEFITQKYIAAQQDETRWQEVLREYDFKTIYFYRHDMTDWAVPFLNRRLSDPAWSLVYLDDFAIILVRADLAASLQH